MLLSTSFRSQISPPTSTVTPLPLMMPHEAYIMKYMNKKHPAASLPVTPVLASDHRASRPKPVPPGSPPRKPVPPRLSSPTSSTVQLKPHTTRFSYAKFRDELVNRTTETEAPRSTQEQPTNQSPVQSTRGGLQERARAFLETGELGSDISGRWHSDWRVGKTKC